MAEKYYNSRIRRRVSQPEHNSHSDGGKDRKDGKDGKGKKKMESVPKKVEHTGHDLLRFILYGVLVVLIWWILVLVSLFTTSLCGY